ncbi:hypothetical protein FA95DRAFT_869593 [Auriscalpium vulgare]|uniref:Uncharacterized protein n=1 Tax=Auriscalpium vulgare TaxID=40419 RepID=A0ACB8R9Z4_9AGAM|nr:hypothetical protein FA95DRAFT_869593 [Auriscalpium vulgare]
MADLPSPTPTTTSIRPEPLASVQDVSDRPPSPPALSKNAQKKARKAALFAERKLQRRAREKEAKKEKKRQRAARAAAGEAGDEDEGRPSKRARGAPRRPFDARVVVDLGFDDKMSEKARRALRVALGA